MDEPHAKSGSTKGSCCCCLPTSRNIATGGGGARSRGGSRRSRMPSASSIASLAACLTQAGNPGRGSSAARAPRRSDAAMAEGRGSVAHLDVEGRILGRGRVSYGKLARGRSTFVALWSSPTSCRLGRVPSRGRASPEPHGAGALEDPSPRVGDRHHRPAPRFRRHRPGGVQPRNRRTAGGDARRAERGRLPSVHLHLDARGRTVPGRTAAPSGAPGRRPRNPRAFLAARADVSCELSPFTGLSRAEAGLGNGAGRRGGSQLRQRKACIGSSNEIERGDGAPTQGLGQSAPRRIVRTRPLPPRRPAGLQRPGRGPGSRQERYANREREHRRQAAGETSRGGRDPSGGRPRGRPHGCRSHQTDSSERTRSSPAGPTTPGRATGFEAAGQRGNGADDSWLKHQP